jgi:hypothetical protein
MGHVRFGEGNTRFGPSTGVTGTSDVPGLDAALADKAEDSALDAHTGDTTNPHGVTAAQAGAIPATEKGTANGVATLDSVGQVPTSQIPPVALNVAFDAADETARLALTSEEVQPGDVVTQADDDSIWWLRAADPSLEASWLNITSEVILPEDSDDIGNLSEVTGPTVTAALDNLKTNKQDTVADLTALIALLSTMSEGQAIVMGAVGLEAAEIGGNMEFVDAFSGQNTTNATDQQIGISGTLDAGDYLLRFSAHVSTNSTATLRAGYKISGGSTTWAINPSDAQSGYQAGYGAMCSTTITLATTGTISLQGYVNTNTNAHGHSMEIWRIS